MPDGIVMKRGNNAGFRSAFVACPLSGRGAVVMTNGDNGGPIVDRVLDRLAGVTGGRPAHPGRNNFAGVAAIGAAFFALKPDFTLSWRCLSRCRHAHCRL
jgi:hypothetical protein